MDFTNIYDIGVNKPIIPKEIYIMWQDNVDLLASIADVSYALIMHVHSEKIEVAISSKNQSLFNPYKTGIETQLGCGLYCETVIEKKSELLVRNALQDPYWKNNPDIEFGMISYYGVPLLWPDNTVFGTICILNKEDLNPSSAVIELIKILRNSIESNLQVLELSYLQEKQSTTIKEQCTKLEYLNKNLEKEVKKEVKKNEEKQKLLFHQSKMAAMGEMIENITHQWRQPLSIISTIASAIKFKNEMNIIEENEINISMESINNSTQHLSQTIDDFRDFFKIDKEKNTFYLKNLFEKTFKLIEVQFKNSNILIIKNIEDIVINSFENELIQVLINILNNARDELIKKESKERVIIIDAFKNNNNIEILIKDNGNGISKDVINNIFKSHFTTKEDDEGTGIGLYMSKIIIEDHLKGTIEATNVAFNYNDSLYKGAAFKITFPIINAKNSENN